MGFESFVIEYLQKLESLVYDQKFLIKEQNKLIEKQNKILEEIQRK